MNLIISSFLTEHPSSLYCFRDVTLYAKSFVFDDIIIKCPKGTRSFYWTWLKRNGAHDFISYLAREKESIQGVLISNSHANLNIDKIDYSNLDFVISFLKNFKKK